jgi:hypothetical protein
MFFALDWHPSEHPPLPDIVAHGRKPAFSGPPGSSARWHTPVAGLPAQYIVQQIADFRSGARTTSVPQRIPPQLMIKTAKGMGQG